MLWSTPEVILLTSDLQFYHQWHAWFYHHQINALTNVLTHWRFNRYYVKVNAAKNYNAVTQTT